MKVLAAAAAFLLELVLEILLVPKSVLGLVVFFGLLVTFGPLLLHDIYSLQQVQLSSTAVKQQHLIRHMQRTRICSGRCSIQATEVAAA
jgi:hypothetical protein